jgi:TPP-dependent pyruvate/acetoin dehydrogenase alpha subunit
MYDPERYRDAAEVERWRLRDPIVLHERRLREEGLLDDALASRLRDEAERAVAAAVEFAEGGTSEPLEDLTRHVHAER